MFDKLKSLGIELPIAYKDGDIKETVSLDGRIFRLYTIEELMEETQIDGMTSVKAKMLSSFANTLQEFMGENTFDQDEKPFSLSRLNHSMAIGDENGDILFIDSSNNKQLGIFYPAGGDVKLLSQTIDVLKR